MRGPALVRGDSVIMDSAVIGEESIGTAMSFVVSWQQPPVVVGTPARAVRRLFSVRDLTSYYRRFEYKSIRIL